MTEIESLEDEIEGAEEEFLTQQYIVEFHTQNVKYWESHVKQLKDELKIILDKAVQAC